MTILVDRITHQKKDLLVIVVLPVSHLLYRTPPLIEKIREGCLIAQRQGITEFLKVNTGNGK